MAQDKDSEGRFAGLRTRAENDLHGTRADWEDVSALSSKEVQRLVHELRVHEIELETQNEDLRRAQIEVEQLKDKYQDLYDFAPMGYVTLNGKGIILEANLTAARLLGVDRQALAKMPFSRFVCKEFRDACYLSIGRVFETQSTQTCEIKLARKDGARFFAQLELVAVQDENGQVNGCRTALWDITARKAAQDDLARANEEWELTFNASSDLVMVLDREHRVLRANKPMADALGMSPQELTGRRCCELVHGQKEPPAFCPHSLLLVDGKEHSTEVKETRLGAVFDVRVSPLKDPDGQFIGSVHVVRDITERKRAEEALQTASAYNRSLIEASLDPLVTISAEGKITDVNTATERVTGYSRERTHRDRICGLFHRPFQSQGWLSTGVS